MPRFRLRGVLERSAQADLFKNTLSKIPTAYGRVAYLASLRDPISGIYRHHGMVSTFGRERSVNALRESHENSFQEWLNMPLKAKYADLSAYLQDLEDTPETVIRHWLQSQTFRNHAPASAKDAEKELHASELQMLLEIFSSAAASGQDQASSPPA